MVDEDLDDENFDTPEHKEKKSSKVVKEEDDVFAAEEHETSVSTGSDEDEEFEIVEEDDKPVASSRPERDAGRSQERRLGRRRPRHRTRGRDGEYVRTLERTINDMKSRQDRQDREMQLLREGNKQVSDASIEAQINEAQRYLDQAKMTHTQAVKDGDGAAASEAVDVMQEARDALNNLRYQKQQIETRSTTKETTDKGEITMPKVDPVVMRKFGQWNAKNDWYDPALGDDYSRIAYRIDNTLTAEGFDPRSKDYWDEFDARLRENPTLRNAGLFEEEDDNYDEEDERMEEEKPRRRETREQERRPSKNGARRPAPQTERSPNAGNSPNGKKRIVVSKDRASAMREMGLQPGTIEWNKMAKKYAAYDKAHNVA